MFARILPVLLLGFVLSACDLTQEIEVELPEYEPEVMVESYLEPGLPFSVVLTQTVGYFDDLKLIYVKEATVSISYGNQTDTLTAIELPLSTPGLELLLDTALLNTIRQFLGETIYLYGSITPVPALYETPFTLNITTKEGKSLSATTIIPKPITFEEPVVRFNDRDKALLLTQFMDDGGQANFYRRVLDKREQEVTEQPDGSTDTAWVTRNYQDFLVDDELGNGQLQVFGTGFDWVEGDTLVQTIYSVTADYYKFVTSRDAAIAASLSPFGQPARLRGNIVGGQGIFTGQSQATQEVVVRR